MTEKEQWTAVDQYITDTLVPQDDALKEALKASAAADLPAINVAANQGKLLYLLAKIQGARNILEIGTLGAYSTIWLARGLAPGGKLTTLEASAKHADVARANLARAGLSDIVELRLGRALDTLPQLDNERRGPFDLIFIDADKVSIAEYFAWSLKLSKPGSVIVVDNVIRSGNVINEKSDDENVRAVRKFNEIVAREKRVESTAIQTVGSKGYDGFAVIRVID